MWQPPHHFLTQTNPPIPSYSTSLEFTESLECQICNVYTKKYQEIKYYFDMDLACPCSEYDRLFACNVLFYVS